MANTTTNQANGATKGQPQPAKARGTQAAASSMPRRRCPHRPGLPATGRHQATLGAARGSPPSGALRRPCCSKAVKKKSPCKPSCSPSRAVPSCVASAQARACSKRACERASKAKRPAASCSKLKRPGGSTQAAPPPPKQQQASMATLRSQAGKAGKQGICGRDKVKARQQASLQQQCKGSSSRQQAAGSGRPLKRSGSASGPGRSRSPGPVPPRRPVAN